MHAVWVCSHDGAVQPCTGHQASEAKVRPMSTCLTALMIKEPGWMASTFGSTTCP
jgi:hypothetical protein